MQSSVTIKTPMLYGDLGLKCWARVSVDVHAWCYSMRVKQSLLIQADNWYRWSFPSHPPCLHDFPSTTRMIRRRHRQRWRWWWWRQRRWFLTGLGDCSHQHTMSWSKPNIFHDIFIFCATAVQPITQIMWKLTRLLAYCHMVSPKILKIFMNLGGKTMRVAEGHGRLLWRCPTMHQPWS